MSRLYSATRKKPFELGIDKGGRAKRGSDTSFKPQGSSCWKIRKDVYPRHLVRSLTERRIKVRAARQGQFGDFQPSRKDSQ